MYQFFLALRYLLSRPINLLGVIGITLGVWALIVVVAIFSGYLAEVKQHVAGASADISALRLPETIAYARFAEVLERDPDVVACAPRVVWHGLLHTAGEHSARAAPPVIGQSSASGVPGADANFVTILGVDPTAEYAVSDLRSWLEAVEDPALRVGDLALPLTSTDERRADAPGILVSVPRAEHHRIGIGSRLEFASARLNRPGTPDESLDVLESQFGVVGAFRSGYAGFDGLHVLTSIDALRSVLSGQPPGVAGDGRRSPSWVNEIAIRIRDGADEMTVAARLQRTLNAGLGPDTAPISVTPSEFRNRSEIRSIDHQRSLMQLVLFVIMVVAGFLVFATLSMMVTEKTHDIGILTAMGASRRGVLAVFLSCGLAISVVGAVLGVITGCVSAIYTDAFNTRLKDWFDIDLFPTRIYNLEHVPCELDPQWIALVGGVAIVVGLVVSGIPAWRASRHDPLQSLRDQ